MRVTFPSSSIELRSRWGCCRARSLEGRDGCDGGAAEIARSAGEFLATRDDYQCIVLLLDGRSPQVSSGDPYRIFLYANQTLARRRLPM